MYNQESILELDVVPSKALHSESGKHRGQGFKKRKNKIPFISIKINVVYL